MVRRLLAIAISTTLGLAVCGLGTSATASAPAPTPAFVGTTDSGVVPPAAGDDPMPITGLLGGNNGFAFQIQDETGAQAIQYHANGGAFGVRNNSGMELGMGASLVNDQLVVAHPGDGGYVATALQMSTGTRTDLADYQTSSANLANYFVTGTGDGWLDVLYDGFADTYTLTRHITGGATTPLMTVPAGAVLEASADPAGVIFSQYDVSVQRSAAYYIDFASGQVTQLQAPTSAGIQEVSLGPRSAAILSQGAITLWERSGPTSPSASVTVGPYVRSFAVNDDVNTYNGGWKAAWVADVPYNQAGDYTPHIFSTDANGHAVELAADPERETTVAAVDAGEFIAVLGNTAPTRGIYRFRSGDTGVYSFPAFLLTGARVPLSVDAGPGRVASASPTGMSTSALSLFSLGMPEGHEVTRLTTTMVPNTSVAFSGGTSAHLEYDNAGNCFAVVDDRVTEISRLATTRYCEGVGLSGTRLLIENAAPDGTSYGTASLVDLNTGATTAQPETTAIYADRLAYMRRDGAVLLRDLAHPASPDTMVRDPGIPIGSSLIGGSRSIVQMYGDWVMWGIRADDGRMLELKAQHLTDPSAPPVDLTGPVDEAALADGIVATLSSTDHKVRVQQLSDGTSTVIGTSRPRTSNRHWLALTDDFVAYVADTGSTMMVPFPETPDADPHLLGFFGPSVIVPGALWTPKLDTSRPLNNYGFVVRNSAGTIVSTSGGWSADGGIRPTWNGRLQDGSLAPPGTYSWTLSYWKSNVSGPSKLTSGQLTVLDGDGYQPLPQARIYGTGAAPWEANVDRDIQVAGLGGVPAGADAVLVNVEVANPSAAGYVRVTPGGTSGSTAVQEFAKGQTVSNLVAVKLSSYGTIRLHLSAGSAAVFVDVAGYFSVSAPDRYSPVPQARVYGSGAPALVANVDRDIQVSGRGGVPAGADAVLVNVEVANPSAAGYLRVTPGGTSSSTAVQQFTKGQAVSNLVAVKLSPSGTIRLHLSAGSAAVFVDVAGYFGPSAPDRYSPVAQARVYGSGAAPLVANVDREILVSGRGGVPAGADAVLVNVEVASPSAAGYVRVTPGGTSSSTAVQEFAKGQTISNLVAVKLSATGTIRLHVSAGSAAVFVDVAGYYKHG